jgi:multidrug efflux pump subunit AcrA (membrane-fusion protein)
MNNKKENCMKIKKLALLGLLLVAAAFILSACGNGADPTQTVQTLPDVSDYSNSSIVAEGRIVPKDSSSLFFVSGGNLDEVLVHEGDSVAKGDVLAKLGDRASFEANVAAAQADVTVAQQALDELNRTAELAYTQAVLDEITAEEAYYVALLAWDDFDQDQYDDDLDQAKADVADAKSDLEDAKDEFNKYASLEKDNADRQRTKTDLDNAQANYDEALSAQAEIEKEYRQLKAEVDLTQARWDEARRVRENREDGADKDQLDLAQAQFDAANTRLSAAEAALDNLDLIAPYDGIIVRLDVSVGEDVNPGQIVAVIADTSEWYVETTDLTENEIVDIQENMEVIVVPDALPELELKGSIESIADFFVEKSGDITYRVRVKLDETDPRLKWGMTTETRFTEPSK